MAELTNIRKDLPWLEHYRKTAEDMVQAREEKWRRSSATFHDQNRKERENAEKRLETELLRQRALLVKIAEANGVHVNYDDGDGGEGEGEGGKGREGTAREESLGAQLTAELNMEISRAGEEAGLDTGKQTAEGEQPARVIISLVDDEGK